MLEALWTVEFVSNVDRYGGGIAVFETGRIFGGDSNFYYLGNYATHDRKITMEVKITNFTGSIESIFGPLVTYNVKLEGEISDDSFEVYGHLVEDPERKIGVAFTRRAELP